MIRTIKAHSESITPTQRRYRPSPQCRSHCGSHCAKNHRIPISDKYDLITCSQRHICSLSVCHIISHSASVATIFLGFGIFRYGQNLPSASMQAIGSSISDHHDHRMYKGRLRIPIHCSIKCHFQLVDNRVPSVLESADAKKHDL